MFLLIAWLLWILWVPILQLIVSIGVALNGRPLWPFLNTVAFWGMIFVSWKFVHDPTIRYGLIMVGEIIGFIDAVLMHQSSKVVPAFGTREIPNFLMFAAAGTMIGCLAGFFWKFPF